MVLVQQSTVPTFIPLLCCSPPYFLVIFLNMCVKQKIKSFSFIWNTLHDVPYTGGFYMDEEFHD